MKLIRYLDNLPNRFRRGAVSIGNFDGVHLGHARIIERLLASATLVGGRALVLTMDPHPAQILRPHQVPPALCWTQRKADLLGQLGVDVVIAYPTDENFLELEDREFFDRVLVGQLEARAVVEGSNFFFGRDRMGNVDRLRGFCADADVTLEVVEPVVIDGRIVSSSRIRELVASGRLEMARRMLTQPYRIRGTVVRGVGRGRKLGYPTANIDGVDTLLPGEGIYAGRLLADGSAWPAAVSIGSNPTFDEGALKIEAHLVGYDGTLYGQEVELDFLARLRDIYRFDSADKLIVQLDRDVADTLRIAAEHEAQGVDQ